MAADLTKKIELFFDAKTKQAEKEIDNFDKKLSKLPGMDKRSKAFKELNKDLSKIGVVAKGTKADPTLFDQFTKKEVSAENAVARFGNLQKKQLGDERKLVDKQISYNRAWDKQQEITTRNTKKRNQEKTASLQRSLDTQSRATKKNTKDFLSFSRAMGALSFLFIGQQMVRTVQTITASTVSMFTQLTKAQTEAGRAITSLSAHFQYFKFSVGNAIATALIPLLPILTTLIKDFATLAQEKPELIASTLMTLGITGVIFQFGAQGILGLAGLKALLGTAWPAWMDKTLGKGAGALSGILLLTAGLTLLINTIDVDFDGSITEELIKTIIAGGLISAAIGFTTPLAGTSAALVGYSATAGIMIMAESIQFGKGEGLDISFKTLAIPSLVGILSALVAGIGLAAAGVSSAVVIAGGVLAFALGFSLTLFLESVIFKKAVKAQDMADEVLEPTSAAVLGQYAPKTTFALEALYGKQTINEEGEAVKETKGIFSGFIDIINDLNNGKESLLSAYKDTSDELNKPDGLIVSATTAGDVLDTINVNSKLYTDENETFIENTNNRAESMKTLADNTNDAADAQERLNDAQNESTDGESTSDYSGTNSTP